MSRSDHSAIAENDLKQQLDAKDQLVRALTDRLEEAAEQLDRVQRTGGDKAARTGGSTDGGPPAQPLLEKLSKSLAVWEDVDPAESFSRIEERLDELRDMLEGAIVASKSDAASPKGKDALTGWEKIKAEMMAEEAASAPPATAPRSQGQPAANQRPQPAASAVAQPPNTSSAGAKRAADPAPVEPPRPLAQLKLPEPVELETASRPQLAEAIEVRDQYISELTRRLRSAESRTHQPIDWETLNNVPDQLRQTLQALESELTDKLRIAEVDLSLERARLSRVETRIRATQIQIEKRLQQSVGLEPPSNQKPAAKKGDAQGKSWFGGRGR